MTSLTPNLLTLLGRFRDPFHHYRAGELTCVPYRHPIGVQNGLRALMAADMVVWYQSNPVTYQITGVGQLAKERFDDRGNYVGHIPIPYGYDAYDRRVVAGEGWELVPEGATIMPGDQPYDLYAGWIKSDGYQADNGFTARSVGRWTAWRRPKS